MELKETLNRIDVGRSQIEASFVFCLWKDPARFDDFKGINQGKDKTLIDEDAVFYFSLGKSLHQQGVQTFDNISLDNYLKDKPNVRSKIESYGGWQTISNMMDLVNTDNTDAYFDQIAKMNTLKILCKKYNEIFEDVGRFDKATNEDVYSAFELLNNSVALTTGHDSKIEDLVVDESYIQMCNSGQDIGLSYAKGAPILNYLTMGAPIGDMYLIAAHSGCGKSSFIFENMVLPFAEGGTQVAIISNEMMSKSYKNLLLVHILTKELGYYKITRKKLRSGHFTDEELDMLRKAAKITKEKYSNILFVKMFENDTGKLIKYIKKLSRSGTKAIVYDTMKSDDVIDDQMWQQLLINSRRIFNVVNKEQIAFVSTFQLSLHTTNQRWLDATCLSNSKQIKEVVSELILCRPLWKDEYTGERFDCTPWRRNKDAPNGKEMLRLDKDKKYIVAFLNKTRSDEDNQCVLFEFQGAWNSWREIGFCSIVNDHKQLG